MSLRINNNIEALNAHRYLAQNDRMLSNSLEKLASGQQINTAADGPASLVVSENMRSQIGGLNQAADNNETAVSLLQTAEGALNEVSQLLIGIRQRTVAAANVGVNDEAMVAASQSEIENALDAIDRIGTNTQFGKQPLLDGTQANLVFQIGANKGQTIELNLPTIAADKLALNVQNASGFQSLSDVDVRTGTGAQDTLSLVDKAIEEISAKRGELGAFQKNSLETNLTSLRIAAENLTAAESNIRDADIAVELTEFTRNQIMTQSSMAQLAQANALPRNLLYLIDQQQ